MTRAELMAAVNVRFLHDGPARAGLDGVVDVVLAECLRIVFAHARAADRAERSGGTPIWEAAADIEEMTRG